MNLRLAFAVLIIMNLLCVGVGMGVPFFCIILGLPLGWYIARRGTMSGGSVHTILRRVLVYALIIPFVTFIAMLVIWGRTATLLFDAGTDFEYFGIPMILYDPRLSFVGWLVLMVVISPFLQLLTTILAAYVTLLGWSRRNVPGA